MPILSSNVVPASATAYEIEQSLRLNSADSSYLTFTPSSNGEDLTWTWSAWVKKCKVNGAANQTIFSVITNSAGSTTTIFFGIEHTSNNSRFTINDWNDLELKTDALYRDVGGWYHFVVSWDVTQATESDRVKVYVNGEQVSLIENTAAAGSGWDGYPPQNHASWMNQTYPHYLGALSSTYSQYMDGYLAEVIMVDGQALDASYFGETGTYGEWKPIEYTGTYGTNGWKLNFSNASSIGEDSSGNGNDWTANNLASTDIVLDSPTNNFATLNSVTHNGITTVLSEGNLKNLTGSTSGYSQIRPATIPMSSGKWYFEYVLYGTNNYGNISLIDPTNSSYFSMMNSSTVGRPSNYATGFTTQNSGTTYIYGQSNVSTSSISNGTVGHLCVDVDTGKVWVGSGGTWYNSGNPANGTNPTATLTGYNELIFLSSPTDEGSQYYVHNFGQDSSFAGNKTAQGNTDDNNIGDFYYSPPSGFLALCTANLPDPAVIPSEHFNAIKYTGDNTYPRDINVGFQADLVWVKDLVQYHWRAFDRLRGTAPLHHDTTASEDYYNDGPEVSTSNNSSGFQIIDNPDGSNPSGYGVNVNGNGNIAYAWKGANSSGSSNTNGDITSTVSANQDAGFSIVSYTGTGSSATIGHGLSSAPEVIFIKRRDSADNWRVYTTAVDGSLDYLYLNLTDAKGDSGASTPTSSVFSLGTNTDQNGSSSTYIAYCFHSVDGFSKIGSYNGNGSTDGTFVYTGFRPAWVMIKATAQTESWGIHDNARNTYNVVDNQLLANGSYAENAVGTARQQLDFTSNGFKMRNAGDANASINNESTTYIYIAFAETPFKYTNAR